MLAVDLLGKTHRNVDLLAKYRRDVGMGASSASANAGKKAAYEAYRTSTEARQFLELRLKASALASTEAPSYKILSFGALTNLLERQSRAIILDFGRRKVTIIGANLTGLFAGLQRLRVEHVQEFDSERFEPPNDAAAPYISEIKITPAENEQSEAEMSKSPPEA